MLDKTGTDCSRKTESGRIRDVQIDNLKDVLIIWRIERIQNARATEF